MNLGDNVQFKVNNQTLTGSIVNIYAVPKDYDLVDIAVNTNDDIRIYYGIPTNEVTLL